VFFAVSLTHERSKEQTKKLEQNSPGRHTDSTGICLRKISTAQIARRGEERFLRAHQSINFKFWCSARPGRHLFRTHDCERFLTDRLTLNLDQMHRPSPYCSLNQTSRATEFRICRTKRTSTICYVIQYSCGCSTCSYSDINEAIQVLRATHRHNLQIQRKCEQTIQIEPLHQQCGSFFFLNICGSQF
jgi:hypothetical protein